MSWSGMMPLRVLVWHQCRLTSEMIAESLRVAPSIGACLVVRDLQAVSVEASRLSQCVAVLAGDIGPGVLETAATLADDAPRCGVVIVATEPAPAAHGVAMLNGNISLVSHTSGMAHLMHAIRGAAVGCATIDAAVAQASPEMIDSPLSDREREVMILTASGSPIKEIATKLCLTAGTVRNVSSSAIRKSASRNRFEAAHVASSRGWL